MTLAMLVLTCAVAVLTASAVVLRPWRISEAWWAAAGAGLMVALGLLPWKLALAALGKGTDVYLFLIGMMLLAELGRREGLFAYLAAWAARRAKGSARLLFALVYAVGVLVTIFLSNDATAVVLTPAVYAAATAAGAEPLPYLFICAFVANAASFVLPISNPANLVVYASNMPPLGPWVEEFALPSALAIVATFVALRLAFARSLAGKIVADVTLPPLSRAGRLAAGGMALTALVLIGASAAGLALGLPTALAGAATTAAILATERQNPLPLLKGLAWSVIPLVGGLFVVVEALAQTGLIDRLGMALAAADRLAPPLTGLGVGSAVAVAVNLVNNLPAGLIASSALQTAHASTNLAGATLIGVDLGPNFSVTGSLATILWLIALRREGLHVGAWQFLRLGIVVTLPALILALGIHALAGWL